jgi:hypothetical protein
MEVYLAALKLQWENVGRILLYKNVLGHNSAKGDTPVAFSPKGSRLLPTNLCKRASPKKLADRRDLQSVWYGRGVEL